jgi:hypothetical protein
VFRNTWALPFSLSRCIIARIGSFKKITRGLPVFFAVLCSGRIHRSSRTFSHTRLRTSFGLAPVW